VVKGAVPAADNPCGEDNGLATSFCFSPALDGIQEGFFLHGITRREVIFTLTALAYFIFTLERA
jgi:hypothetical protein